MIVECHVILVENLAESSNESFDESFIIFYFDFVAENYHDDADQNSHSTAESYSSLL